MKGELLYNMIDLHMHTKYSDGTDTAEEILKNVESKGLNTIAITDHNNALVYEELEKMNIKEYYSGRIIPGVELNTKVLGIPIEILGYGINYKLLNELAKKIYIPAEERNKIEVQRLYSKCIKAGMKIESNCMDRYSPDMFASKFIHSELIKFEENKQFLDEDVWNDTILFYRKYMSNPECMLYVEMDDFVPDFNTAADLVKRCGGLVFLPHIFEYKENSRRVLNYIMENYKFDGIECFYTTFTKEQSQELLDICKTNNLYISGGSDYHGKAKPKVDVGVGYGNLQVNDDIIDAWKDKVEYFI